MNTSTENEQLTKIEKIEFESHINDVINHPFLHYHPYICDDETVLSNANKSAEKFQKFHSSYMELLDQCCSTCHIGEIEEAENPYVLNAEGETIIYKTLPIHFCGNNDVHVNKSDFSPRNYLTIFGFRTPLFPQKHCDKYTVETGKHVKTCSLVNNGPEIEKFQNKNAIMAYSLLTASDYGSIRPAYRLYIVEDNIDVIREQVLLTQQYVLCSLIHFPGSTNMSRNKFDHTIFEKYLPTLEQMYESVCLEIKDRGLTPNVKEEYIPRQ